MIESALKLIVFSFYGALCLYVGMYGYARWMTKGLGWVWSETNYDKTKISTIGLAYLIWYPSIFLFGVVVTLESDPTQSFKWFWLATILWSILAHTFVYVLVKTNEK